MRLGKLILAVLLIWGLVAAKPVLKELGLLKDAQTFFAVALLVGALLFLATRRRKK